VVGLSFRRISALFNKLVTTVSYIANHPTTRLKRPDVSFFGTPERERLFAYIQTNAETRRMTIGQLLYNLGYTCSNTTVRRALKDANYFRYLAKSAPFITDTNQVKRVSYVDVGLVLLIFYWGNCAWSNEELYDVGGYQSLYVTRKPGSERYLSDYMVPRFKKR
jgi:Transposase